MANRAIRSCFSVYTFLFSILKRLNLFAKLRTIIRIRKHLFVNSRMINIFLIQNLLSDAEILEDIAEDFVGGDFAGDFADVLETLAEVLREEVAGNVAGKAVVHTAN